MNAGLTHPARHPGRDAGGRDQRAGYRLVAPAILQPRSCSSISPARIRKPWTTPPTPRAVSSARCWTSLFRFLAIIWHLPRPVLPESFCYLGPVSENRGASSAEFLQAGIEFSAARTRRRPTPRSGLGLEAITHYGVPTPEIRLGDVGLFAALIAALELAPAWKRRLVKDFNRKTSLAHDLDVLTLTAADAKPEYQGVLAALAGSDPKGARALVADLLSIAGISAVGGRSVGEIAERFLEQSALGASNTLPGETRTLIERFLAVSGYPDEAAAELRALARNPRSYSDPRSTCSRAAPVSSLRAASMSRASSCDRVGRGFDYYSGFVFQLHNARRRDRPADRRWPLRWIANKARRQAPFPRSASRSGSSGSPLQGAA